MKQIFMIIIIIFAVFLYSNQGLVINLPNGSTYKLPTFKTNIPTPTATFDPVCKIAKVESNPAVRIDGCYWWSTKLNSGCFELGRPEPVGTACDKCDINSCGGWKVNQFCDSDGFCKLRADYLNKQPYTTPNYYG